MKCEVMVGFGATNVVFLLENAAERISIKQREEHKRERWSPGCRVKKGRF